MWFWPKGMCCSWEGDHGLPGYDCCLPRDGISSNPHGLTNPEITDYVYLSFYTVNIHDNRVIMFGKPMVRVVVSSLGLVSAAEVNSSVSGCEGLTYLSGLTSLSYNISCP